MTTEVVDDSDAGLVLRSRAEPHRFAALFDRYFAELHRYAARRLGRAGGDDVAAETFLVAFSQRHGYDPGRGSVRAWLYGIATNLIRNQWRDEERGYRAYAAVRAAPLHRPNVRLQPTQRPSTVARVKYAGRATLSRDGEEIGSSADPMDGRFTVPPGAARYRLGVTATRDTAVESTRVDAAWEFTSDTAPAPAALPVTFVRYAPALDDRNRAPAGRPFPIPLRLERFDAAGYGAVTGVTVDVSYDDGASWRPVKVTGTGMTRTAVVHHPAGAGFASLRARVTDDAGNTAEQTIIRAYGLA